MSDDGDIPAFSLKVDEVFALGGATVLVGRLVAGEAPVLAPCDAELVVDGASRGIVRLESERMPGPGSAGRRAVETRSEVDPDCLRARSCVLVHR